MQRKLDVMEGYKMPIEIKTHTMVFKSMFSMCLYILLNLMLIQNLTFFPTEK